MVLQFDMIKKNTSPFKTHYQFMYMYNLLADWKYGDPTAKNVKNCLHLTKASRLIDRACTRVFYTVCEFNYAATTAQPTTSEHNTTEKSTPRQGIEMITNYSIDMLFKIKKCYSGINSKLV